MHSKSKKNYLLFIVGVLFIAAPLITRLRLDFGDLPSAPDGIKVNHEIRSGSYVVAFKDLERPKLTPHLIEYELFINIKNDNNPFNLKKGSLKIKAAFNCSNEKHFFKSINYSKYNNFSEIRNDELDNLSTKWKDFEKLYNDYVFKSREIFDDICPILLNSDFLYAYNNSNEATESLKSLNAKIGVIYNFKDVELKIEEVIKDSPADKSGISIGDAITEIDDVAIDRFGIDVNKRREAVFIALRGMHNTKVNLKIRKNNSADIVVIPVNREEPDINLLKFYPKRDSSMQSNSTLPSVDVSCKQDKSWPIPNGVGNNIDSLVLHVTNEFNSVGLIGGENIYDFPNNDWNVNSYYYASTKYSIPVCQVLSIPESLKNKKFLLLRRYEFRKQK